MENFPDYKKVVPANNEKSLVVPSKDFIDSIERVASVSLDGKEGVKLLINKENVQFSVNSANSGEGNEVIKAILIQTILILVLTQNI